MQTRYQFGDYQNRVRLEQDVSLGRLGKSEDIAEMIVVLIAMGHYYITGQNFFCEWRAFDEIAKQEGQV